MTLEKLLHELIRPIGILILAPIRILEWLFATPYYDYVLSRKRLITVGNQPSKNKMAIYVVYPVSGIKQSHIASLNWLVETGYSPLIVSNSALSLKDRERLRGHCWKLIERPNFGYDFGGYREGVLHLNHQIQSIDRLALFNDSCWFPVPSNANWLHTAEQMNKDFVGSVPNVLSLECVSEEPESSNFIQRFFAKKKFHYGSFALLFSNSILSDPRFLQFWTTLRLSNCRRRTFRRGEIGLSRYVFENSFTHGTTLNNSNFAAGIRTMDDRGLKSILSSLVLIELSSKYKSWRAEIETLTEKGDEIDDWRKRAIGLLRSATLRNSCAYILPEHIVKLHSFGFLKKSLCYMGKDSKRKMQKIVDELGEREWGFDLQDEAYELGLRR